jgi:transglutaminase-like putative cysteine protease
MEYGAPIKVDFVVGAEFRQSSLNDLQFVAPLPPTTDRQRLVSVSVDKEASTVEDNSPLRRPLLLGYFKERAQHKLSKKNNVIISYSLELTPRKLVATTEENALPPSLDNPQAFLRSDDTIDWNSESFLRWLKKMKLERQPNESPLEFARKLYDTLKECGRYKYPPPTPWKASMIATKSRSSVVGDCGTFSILFVAACRANGIPSRLLSGQWAENTIGVKRLAARDLETHVYSEFYDSSIGWIPADISMAMAVKDSRSDDLFGTDWTTPFVTMHFDADIQLPIKGMDQVQTQWLLAPVGYNTATGQRDEAGSHLAEVTIMEHNDRSR